MAAAKPKRKHPAAWVPTLYTVEGLPFVIVATVTSLMYKSFAGLDPRITDARITFWTGLVAVPWALKPIWGPLLEMFKTKKFFVLATQFIGGVTFGLLALSLHMQAFFAWSIAAFGIIAINFAIHDTAADGVYVTALDAKEQAQFVGWQGAFYNVGKVLSQGALVFLAGMLENRIGVLKAWTLAMGGIGLLFVVLALYHAWVLPAGARSAVEVTTLKEVTSTFWDVVVTFFRKQYIWWGIAFLVLFRFAEGQAIKVVPLFLRSSRAIGGLGLSTQQVGKAYGVLPVLAFILGSVVSGYFTANRGLRKAMLILCVAFNLPFLVYALLAITQPTSLLVISCLMGVEYFGYGFGFVALILFMMQQIAPGKYKTAHYAFATSIMQFGFLLPSMGSGFLSDHLGYRKFFLWVIIATIPSFLITWLVPFREIPEEDPAATV
jgi:PAT family beta-lactamase induction signal transducer AmpG